MTDKPALLAWKAELKNDFVHSGECVNHSVCKCPHWTLVRSFRSLEFQDVMVYIRSWQRGGPSFIVGFDLKQVDFLHVIYMWLCLVGGFVFYGIMIIILLFLQIFDRQQGFKILNIRTVKHLYLYPVDPK